MSDKNELRRAKQKRAALMRAEFNAKVALERIDFTIDVLDPAMREVERQVAAGELPVFEIGTE